APNATTAGVQITAMRRSDHAATASATTTTIPFGRSNVATTPSRAAQTSWWSSTSTNAHAVAARNSDDGYVSENTNVAGNSASAHTAKVAPRIDACRRAST